MHNLFVRLAILSGIAELWDEILRIESLFSLRLSASA
jgi:hypothetical protein